MIAIKVTITTRITTSETNSLIGNPNSLLIWNNLTFDTDCFIQLEERHVTAKCQALREYKSQGFRDYTSPEFVRSLARTRGVQVGCQYAEAFEVIRLFL